MTSGINAEYQRQVRNAFVIAPTADKQSHAALGLAAEAGEVADLIKKSQYATPRPIEPTEMLLELGDALWYLTALADLYGWSLSDLMVANVHKLSIRHADKGWYDFSKLLEAGGVTVSK